MRFLHVADGSCTTRVIEAAGIPGMRSTWADPLYEGPVPGGLEDDELLKVRARFLAAPTEASYVESGGAGRSAQKPHRRAAVPRARRRTLPAGVSVDDRRLVAPQAPPAAARRTRANRRRRRVSAHASRWFGGVHGHDGATVWRWDDERGRMT